MRLGTHARPLTPTLSPGGEGEGTQTHHDPVPSLAARGRGGSACLLIGALALCACPKDERPGFDEADRTIQKLKAEQARLDKGGAPGSPPIVKQDKQDKQDKPDPLAEAVIANAPPVTLTLPASAPVQAGAVTFSAKRLESMQTVSGTKASLSTAERFVKVTLTAFCAKGPTEVQLDLAQARLKQGTQEFPVARDVQRLGGTPLSAFVGTEPQDVVIFFEVPPGAVKKGLTLVLPAGPGVAELPLQ